MYGGFQEGPQLGPPDAERRQSLGQTSWTDVQDVLQVSAHTKQACIPYTGIFFVYMPFAIVLSHFFELFRAIAVLVN